SSVAVAQTIERSSMSELSTSPAPPPARQIATATPPWALDSRPVPVQDQDMVEHTALGEGRAHIGDARRDGRFLRVSWHDQQRQFVVSNWEGTVCVGATRLDVRGASALMGALADGLAEAADGTRTAPRAERSKRSLRDHLREWWRVRKAQGAVAEIRSLRGADSIERRRSA